MATNEIYDGGPLSVVCSNPAAPAAGDPVRYGQLTGVALTDEAGGGNATGYTTVDFGMKVWDLYVFDEATTGVAVGDPIFYDDTAGGDPATHLTNVATGMEGYFGVALEAVGANATTKINVLHIPVGSSIAIANGAVSAGMLAADAVLTASILDANVTAAKLAAALQGSADGLGFMRAARFTFDPSATAGMRTIAAHGLGVTIPDNAVILNGYIEILTTFTSAGADAGTIALHVEGANDLVTATAISSGTFWDAVKGKVIVPDALNAAGVATSIKTSQAREITATVAEQALTAGKLVGWLFYVIGA